MLRNAILFPLLLLAALGSPHPIARASEISLEKAVVVVDVAEASYVHYTVNELRQQIKGVTGRAPVLSYDLNEAKQAPGVLIVVGRAMANELAQQDGGVPQISDREPGAQGFILKSVRRTGNKGVVLAAGSDSTGTNYAVMELRQLLTESPMGLTVSDSLAERQKPRFKVRGLYLHQHWRYNYPYAAWSWSVEDWKRALDMAAYLRVNLVMLWPHMDMIAPPLSVPEQDYLADIREVIEYAHRKRGLEIWMVETPNGVLDDPEAKGLPVDRRDFYAYEYRDGSRNGRRYPPGSGLKNPGDPKGFAVLMANREALYRNIPNADGYGLIDADTGGWPGSPSSAFVDIFVGNRKLLDQYHKQPRQAKLFYWMGSSWGTGTVEENFRNTLSDFSKRIKNPWELLFYPPYLKVVQELNCLDRAVIFPYGQVEGEPSLPLTTINFQTLGRTVETAAEAKGLLGVMANVQTFVVQLPNIFYLVSSTWNGEAEKAGDTAVLRSLAKLLFPEKAQVLVNGWTQLKAPGSAASLAAAQRMGERRDAQMGRLGTLGSYVFPQPSQLLSDLTMMLQIHASAERVREQVTAAAPVESVTQAFAAYFQEMLKWQKQCGFFGAYGVNKQVIYDNFIYGPDAMTVKVAWGEYTKGRTDRESLQAAIRGILSTKEYADWVVKSMTGQVFGTYQMKGEGTMDVP